MVSLPTNIQILAAGSHETGRLAEEFLWRGYLMNRLLKILLGAILTLSITNCSLFGGGSSDNNDAYDDAESAYGDQDADAAAKEESTKETPDAYVNQDAYGDADASEKTPLDLETDSDSAGTAAEADVSFGENEDAPQIGQEYPTLPAMPTRETSAVGFKQGMYDFGEDCQMREDPAANGTPAGMVRAGKKLWVEPVDNNWLRVYKKAGPVFISRDCLQ